MTVSSFSEVKKSFYLFLMSLLGAALFFLLHRLVFFAWAVLASVSDSGVYYTVGIWVLEYFTLVIALLGGLWYGIWVGMDWYKKVYEEGTHRGFVEHISRHMFPYPRFHSGTSVKLIKAAEHLEQDLLRLESLASEPVKLVINPKPIKRTATRKRVARRSVKSKA